MADRDFDIQVVPITGEPKYTRITVRYCPVLSGRPQLAEAEVKESQGIASVRIHVEHAIQRIKKSNKSGMKLPSHCTARLIKYGLLHAYCAIYCLH